MIFNSLITHPSLGIIVSDKSGKILSTNPWMLTFLGYEVEQLVGKNIDIIIPYEMREEFYNYKRKYYSTSTPNRVIRRIEIDILKKNGHRGFVDVYLFDYATQDDVHTISFYSQHLEEEETQSKIEKIAIELELRVSQRTKELSEALTELNYAHSNLEREIEKKKEAEKMILSNLEKEKELNELKSRFVCMASHEFRTPLAGILTSATLIEKYNQMGEPQKMSKHILTIKKSIKSLTNILNEFLSLDKLDQGAMEAHISCFSLKMLVEETINQLKDLSGRNQKITINHQNEDVILIQDQEILRNILINLLSNAIKYSPEGKDIELSSHISGSDIIITVKDEGIGIPSSDQKFLFQRFFRAKNVNTIQGTGLGLSIVKSYLELIGGTISFTSTENKGATFEINFPLERK